MKVYGYCRVSTGQQGLGLEAQRARLEEECERRGWIPLLVDEKVSGKNMKRPELQNILDNIKKGDVIMAAKLDRLSRSVLDFSELMSRAYREQWEIVLLEPSVDTTTPHGKFTANIFAAVAELEREMISQRTKEALAVLKARGVRLGAPPSIPEKVVRRIVDEHNAGFTLREIAQGLELDQIPTIRGGEWQHTTVDRVIKRAVQSPA